jgi:hypothetical protein
MKLIRKTLIILFASLICHESSAKSDFPNPVKIDLEITYSLHKNKTHLITDSSKNKTLVPYLKANGKYVFVDSASMQQINIREYKNATFFHEGIASVQARRKYGFIDQSGNWLIRPKYSDASVFSEGLCSVRKGKKWGYINQKGEMIIPYIFSQATIFKGGQASVAMNGTANKIEKQGNIIYSEKFYFGQLSNFWTIPNIHASPMLDTIPIYKGIPDKELILVKINGKYGFQNQDGVLIISAKYDVASRFEGFPYTTVRIDNKYGVINRLGQLIIPIKYDKIEKLNEHIFIVGIGKIVINQLGYEFNGKWGAIDVDGKEILKPIYSEIGEVKQGFLQIQLNDSYFFADKLGKIYKD